MSELDYNLRVKAIQFIGHVPLRNRMVLAELISLLQNSRCKLGHMNKLLFAFVMGSGVSVMLLNLPAVGSGDKLVLLFGGSTLICGAAVAWLVRSFTTES